MEYLSNFPDRLRELMFYHDNIKSEALAKELGVSGGTVRSWLRGETLISLAHAVTLADFFRCSLDYLAARSTIFEEVQPCGALPPFYQRIRAVIHETGKTRYAVTKNTEIKDSHFTNWSRGKAPKLASACILADFLEVSLDYLIGRRAY